MDINRRKIVTCLYSEAHALQSYTWWSMIWQVVILFVVIDSLLPKYSNDVYFEAKFYLH